MWIRYGLIGLWMLSIFLFSHQPASSSDKQSGFFVAFIEPITPDADGNLLTFFVRKSAHFILYFILGVLVFNALHKTVPSRRKAILISICVVFGYAALDEIHQLFIPGRSGEVRDVLLDTVAGTIGIGVFASIQSLRARLALKRKM
ncbi:VanZ family protein [Candidatus Saccharibacteria bacterium TM7i]|nr:VanZ family protein [Candidatus Saccharibacteria bacterium TM7i]